MEIYLWDAATGEVLWRYNLVRFAAASGTVTGYIAYDWIHYYTHHFSPKNRVGRWLKRYHLLHHFDEHHGTKRFGVSNPLWDLVFGTYRPVSGNRAGSSTESDRPSRASLPASSGG